VHYLRDKGSKANSLGKEIGFVKKNMIFVKNWKIFQNGIVVPDDLRISMKTSLVLHVCWTTNQKGGGMHDFGFFRVGGHFSPLGWLPPFSSLILFIS
jgi:hypothetical protein